jgi:hypothetical protein
MARRLPALSLLLAWLCASGAMLDVAQVAAWARMFAGYVRTESVAAAARETFDPAKPCQICRAVSKARAAAAPRAAVPPAGPEKIILIFERSALLLAGPAQRIWPALTPARAWSRAGDVPVPPPRGGALSAPC